jgi:hypothetical protein
MMLYAGTFHAIPRKEFEKKSPDISVKGLTEHDISIKVHFSKPEVQNIGSTASCGCDFPNVLLQDGEWPSSVEYERDPEQLETERVNREGLVNLLRHTGEQEIEIYTLWYGSFTDPPIIHESVPLERILDTDFRFKERGFYQVSL